MFLNILTLLATEKGKVNLFWKEQLQEAVVTSTSGQADVGAGLTEPGGLGRGPWAAEILPSGKGTVLGSGWIL